MMTHRGFTLTEMLITVTIVGILASMALPSYQRAVERAIWRGAQDILMTIHTGEQVYFTLNKNQYQPITSSADWAKIFMDDPAPPDGSITYTVSVDNTVPSFTATATRNGLGSCATETLQISQSPILFRTLSGSVWGGSGIDLSICGL